MLKSRNFIVFFIFLSFSLVFLTNIKCVKGQTGNTISGYVFTQDRKAIYDINVELLDDFSRTLARTRTNASGRFFFSGFPSGRFRVRILPSGSDFEEQELEVEIQNFLRPNQNGGTITTGFENVQRDFYLKKRKNNQPSNPPEAIFVQEIPAIAKETYQNAIVLLNNNKNAEGLKDLKTAIEIFPDYFEAIERLGTEYIKLKYYEAAQILLNRAVEINPRGYQSWYGLGYTLYSLNSFKEASQAINKSLEILPNSIDSLILNGVNLRKLKNYKEAVNQLKKAKSLANPPLADIHWQLALIYGHNLNLFNEAADELELYLKAKLDTTETENIQKLIKQFRDKAKANK